MPTKTKVEKASEKAHILDQETRDLLGSVEKKNNTAMFWFAASWTILFVLAVFGLYYQNHLATQNKQHIDCIIKDLATPLPQNSRSKYISNLSTDCKIKFTN